MFSCKANESVEKGKNTVGGWLTKWFHLWPDAFGESKESQRFLFIFSFKLERKTENPQLPPPLGPAWRTKTLSILQTSEVGVKSGRDLSR